MKYAFIQAHREEFRVRAMCRMLRIHVSGFYAWLREPVSTRAKEDARQTTLIREAWSESGKVYGYRKLHDDLRDQGEACSPSRVARLRALQGSQPRSATGGVPDGMVASPRSSPRTSWTASSRLMRQIGPG